MQQVSTRMLIFLVIILSILAAVLWSVSQHFAVRAIDSYDACAKAGYPILESYPSQCRTPDGRTFVNPHEQAVAPPAAAASTTSDVQTGEGCIIGGCSREICGDLSAGPAISICIYNPQFACYKNARCERQADGKCGWTQTYDLVQCLKAHVATSTPEELPQ